MCIICLLRESNSGRSAWRIVYYQTAHRFFEKPFASLVLMFLPILIIKVLKEVSGQAAIIFKTFKKNVSIRSAKF